MDDTVTSVSIHVEVPSEYTIQEITYAGEEIYQTPPTLSETLAKLASKIDWAAAAETRSEVEQEEEEDAQPTVGPVSHHWESVKAKLKASLTEVCVLNDVLSVAKEKKFMVLDPVQQDPSEPRPYAQLLAKKRGLTAASTVLINGAERLRVRDPDPTKNKGSQQQFHSDLSRLRVNWRLKKLSSVAITDHKKRPSIVGDLSYHSVGSRFWQSGLFEVSKAEEGGEVPNFVQSGIFEVSSLRITIPIELRGHAYIQVTIQKDQDSLTIMQLTSNPGRHVGTNNIPPPPDHPWQRVLESAQNVLFCKELFTRLAREAVFLQSQLPPLVVENKIVVSLYPGIHLVISLVHNTEDNPQERITAPGMGRCEHSVILEHAMHQFLLQSHHLNLGPPAPHPSSAPMGPNKKRRMAGPAGVDKHTLIEMMREESILEKIVHQGQHMVMRSRTALIIDNLARDIKDPCISSHWNLLNSPTLSTVKINIVTQGYDTLWRTALVLHVSELSIRCIGRDGKLHTLSYESQELRDLILMQVAQQHLTAAQMLARFLSWQVIGSTQSVGHGSPEPLANAPACLLASPYGNRVVAVKCSPQTAHPQAFVAKFPSREEMDWTVSKDDSWRLLQAPFEEVNLDQVDGKNFIQKLESVLAMLTNTMEKVVPPKIAYEGFEDA